MLLPRPYARIGERRRDFVTPYAVSGRLDARPPYPPYAPRPPSSVSDHYYSSIGSASNDSGITDSSSIVRVEDGGDGGGDSSSIITSDGAATAAEDSTFVRHMWWLLAGVLFVACAVFVVLFVSTRRPVIWLTDKVAALAVNSLDLLAQIRSTDSADTAALFTPVDSCYRLMQVVNRSLFRIRERM